jgi:hypothetical protein
LTGSEETKKEETKEKKLERNAREEIQTLIRLPIAFDDILSFLSQVAPRP